MRTVSGEVRKVQMDLNFLNNALLKYLLLWKRPAIRGTIIGFPAKWRLSMLMMCHYPDLGVAFDWLRIYLSQSEALPRSGLWRVINMEFLHSTSFLVETSGGVAICRLWSALKKLKDICLQKTLWLNKVDFIGSVNSRAQLNNNINRSVAGRRLYCQGAIAKSTLTYQLVDVKSLLSCFCNTQ